MDSLTETMDNARLDDQSGELEELLFRPQADSGLPENALDHIPRYLFRVVSLRSRGETNESWARSESAYRNKKSSMEDIFLGLGSEKRRTIASTLNLHLRWRSTNSVEDNFVSWTSSLLYAIQYIYYRHFTRKDESRFEDFKLYVIDTARFPRGTFIRDLDLINTFCEYDDPRNLKNFQSLRKNGRYYFGEYLSQGALKIAGKHQMISAKSLVDGNLLHRLQPQFDDIESENKKPEWANGVLRLRDNIWLSSEPQRLSSSEMLDRLEVVGKIADKLEPGWRLPIAIYFAALIGPQSETEDQETKTDNVFFDYFRSKLFYSLEKGMDFGPSNFQVIAPDEMPELKRVKDLVREIHKDSQLRQMLDKLESVEKHVRHLHRYGGGFIAADTNKVLDSAGQSVLSRIRTVQELCEEVA